MKHKNIIARYSAESHPKRIEDTTTEYDIDKYPFGAFVEVDDINDINNFLLFNYWVDLRYNILDVGCDGPECQY